MGAAAVSRGAQLGVVVVVARQLDPAEFGLFVFATGGAFIAGLVGSLGWQMSFNRFFSLARHDEDWSTLRGLMRASNRVVITGCLLAALLLTVAGALAGELAFGLLGAAMLTIPYGLTALRRQQLAGTGQAPHALLLDQGLASIVLFFPALLFRLTLFEMLAIYAGAMVVGNAVATVLINRRLPGNLREYPPQYEMREWMSVSLTLLLARSARLLLSRLDVILVSTLAGLAQAGLYGAALRATYILTFPQFVLQTINGPQFADAFAAGKPARVSSILKGSLLFAGLTSLPPLILFVAAPSWTMSLLFGTAYAEGAVALVLIAIGQFAIGLGMPFNSLLTMAGRQGALSWLNIGVLVVSVGLSFALIPAYGAAGAGVVTAVSGLALLVGQIGLSRPALRGRISPEPGD
jgi:O-antigen/teichoic acid export membrane protein